MRETLRDPQRLDHILESINNIQNSGCNIKDLEPKDLRYYGIVKLLEIIGEAAYKLTNEFKENHPDIPWKSIINLRHILVHGYYTINKENVEIIINEDLPLLKSQISECLKEYPPL